MLFDTLSESNHPLVAVRPIEHDDLPHSPAYLGLPEVYEHTSWNGPTVESLSRNVWRGEARAPAQPLRLAAVPRSTNRLVGTIASHTVWPENRSAELAYDLSPQVWGQGVAARLVPLLTAWGHTHAQLIRVQATVLETNTRSLRVLERAGFEREGYLRCHRVVRGRIGHFFMYAHIQAPV